MREDNFLKEFKRRGASIPASADQIGVGASVSPTEKTHDRPFLNDEEKAKAFIAIYNRRVVRGFYAKLTGFNILKDRVEFVNCMNRVLLTVPNA